MNLKSALAGDLKNETRAKHRGHMPERKNRYYRPVAIKKIAFPERGNPPDKNRMRNSYLL